MFPFELLALGGLLLLVFKELTGILREDGVFRFLPVPVILCLIFHLIFEGYRWQMFPLYFGGLLSLFSLVDLRGQAPSAGRIWLHIGLLISGGMVVFLCLAFPVRMVQQGPYSAGFYEEPGKEIYFPVKVESDNHPWPLLSYWIEPTSLVPQLVDMQGIPPFFWTHLNRYQITVITESLDNSKERLPSVMERSEFASPLIRLYQTEKLDVIGRLALGSTLARYGFTAELYYGLPDMEESETGIDKVDFMIDHLNEDIWYSLFFPLIKRQSNNPATQLQDYLTGGAIPEWGSPLEP